MPFHDLGFGREPLSPFAADPAASLGRLVPEPESPTRTPYQRDRDRIVHSTAFRRLAYKTQVFVYHEGDHYRSRLTHTIEVAQIARALARALRADEHLTETLALAHDLGHTPFGHTGEDALDEAMASFGGFDHNAQTLRIVTRLEHRYAAFDGLNLCFETLDGLIKHNGPLTDAQGMPAGRYAQKGLPYAYRDYEGLSRLDLAAEAGLEAQLAAISDDIAYNAHDIDDGLRAGHIALEPLCEAVPLIKAMVAEIDARHPGLDRERRISELTRRLITAMVEAVLSETTKRLERLAGLGRAAILAADAPVVAFTSEMAATDKAVKAYLFPALYRHPKVVVVREQAAMIVKTLFAHYLETPGSMPAEWEKGLSGGGERGRARRACDYIAGMTDRYAHHEHQRLFDDSPRLR